MGNNLRLASGHARGERRGVCRGGRGWSRKGEVDGEERVIKTKRNRDVRDALVWMMCVK